MLLISVIAAPAIGAFLVLLTTNKPTAWRIGLVSSITSFFLSTLIWWAFKRSPILGTYQYGIHNSVLQEEAVTAVHFGYIELGVDGLSLYFLLLTTLLTPVCLLAARNTVQENVQGYVALFLVLEALLCLVFTVRDLMLFYVFFESVLVPLFLVVGVYGTGSMRVRASYLLFLYTLFGSLAMLLAFVSLYYYAGTTDMQVLAMHPISVPVQRVLFVGIVLSIVIKTPLVPFNTWLTYAHSEAPVGGSIILAGVILKLATYGYVRVVLTLLPEASHYYAPVLQLLGCVSVVYASLATIRQTDYKKLVAYSSVAHMGVVVLGLFSGTVEGIEGALLLSLAHGLVSPALFYLVGGVVYDRYHTRSIRYFKGLTVYMPIFSAIFFIFTISNAAVPMTANWLGEFMVLTGLYQRSVWAAGFAATGIVLSAIYSVWLYARMSFGSWGPYLEPTVDLTRREYAILLPLIILTVLLGVAPGFVLADLHTPVSALLYTVT